MVGVVARVASVQVPWHTVEEPASADFTNHITVLEAMLAEMQRRVRGARPSVLRGPHVVLLTPCCCDRFPFHSGALRPPSPPGLKQPVNAKSPTTLWRT